MILGAVKKQNIGISKSGVHVYLKGGVKATGTNFGMMHLPVAVHIYRTQEK